MIFDFDFKSFCFDDFDFDFKIILRLIYDFKQSKSSSKSSDRAKDAILAAVSHRTYKLKWVPPDNCSEVSQAFVEAVAMMDTASTTVAESTSSQLIAGLEGDDVYGYGENNCSSLAVASSTSQVKAEAMNFLSDADKSLSRLHFFPTVQRLFLRSLNRPDRRKI